MKRASFPAPIALGLALLLWAAPGCSGPSRPADPFPAEPVPAEAPAARTSDPVAQALAAVADLHGKGGGEPAAVSPIPTRATFEPLTRGGIRGGKLTTMLPGSTAEVHQMLLDFDNAAGRRSFAHRFDVISRDADRAEVALTLRGKMGVSPKIRVLYQTEKSGDRYTIRYGLTQKAFGITSYAGEYVLEPVSGRPARSRFTSSLFVSSGTAFANEHAADIERGQRRDAEEMRLWMRDRLLESSEP